MGESNEKKSETTWKEDLGSFLKELIDGLGISESFAKLANRLRMRVGLKTREELNGLKDEVQESNSELARKAANETYEYGKNTVDKLITNTKATVKRFKEVAGGTANKYFNYVLKASEATKIELPLILAVINVESGWQEKVTNNKSSAGGLGQFLTSSWPGGVAAAKKYMGVNLSSAPETRLQAEPAIYATVSMMRDNFDKWDALVNGNFNGFLVSSAQVGGVEKARELTNMIIDRLRKSGKAKKTKDMGTLERAYLAYSCHRDGTNGGFLRTCYDLGVITKEEHQKWGWPASRGKLDSNMVGLRKNIKGTISKFETA